MCWYNTGSPPPAASKKLVSKNLSVSNMVTAPAKTGMIAINKNAVINQVHTNNGIFIKVMPGARILKMVAITLMAPMIEEIPSKCTEKIANGKALPVCNTSGGYKVHPE